jgi:UDP-glucuronate decarboxylase
MNVDFSPLKNKSVMLTGSTGFLGSHLLKALQGYAEYIYTPSRKYLMAECPLLRVDYIIHAAGYAVPSIFTKDPLNTIRVNTEMVFRLMEYLKPNGSFLFCSTSEIYKGCGHLVMENDIGTTNPQHERAAYIEGKRCGEAIIGGFVQQGIRAKIARISLAYGPGTKAGDARVLNQFIEQALVNGVIKLRDDGSAMPTYCYIDDMVEMMLNVLLHGKQDIYNLGGRSRMSLEQLAHWIGDLTGANVKIPESPEGIPFVTMDINRYCKEFGKEDFIHLGEGLQKTIDYQKGLYGRHAIV